MIHKDDAARIKREVREFYANGVKSGNKVYVTGADPDKYVNISDPFDGYWQSWSNIMKSQKARTRNENALLSMQDRPDLGSESFYTFGKRIYDGGKRTEFASGNCMEMAAVSAAIAIDDYHFAPDWLYLGAVNPPGDHAFCLLSIRKPGWNTPSDMVKGSGAGAAYIIDPWLNTACAADEYWGAVQVRVKKWASDGKRIAWKGNDGKHLGWYCPDREYAKAFAVSPLTFVPVTEQQ